MKSCLSCYVLEDQVVKSKGQVVTRKLKIMMIIILVPKCMNHYCCHFDVQGGM